MIKLTVLRWEDDPGLLKGPLYVLPRVLVRGRQEGGVRVGDGMTEVERDWLGDAMLLVLKMEDAVSQAMPVSPGCRKRREKRFSCRRKTALWTHFRF